MYNTDDGNEANGEISTSMLPSLTLQGGKDHIKPISLHFSSSSTSSSSSSSSESVYEERLVVEVLSQGVFGQDPGVKNELGQEQGEMLKPHLKSRHVIMISLGTVLGSGLFLGT